MKKTGWTTHSMDDDGISVEDALKLMASQGSQIFNTIELLGMGKLLELVLHI